MGFGVSEVTRDLHADGIHGVMTDYEEKFHNLGTPINAVWVPWAAARSAGASSRGMTAQKGASAVWRKLLTCAQRNATTRYMSMK